MQQRQRFHVVHIDRPLHAGCDKGAISIRGHLPLGSVGMAKTPKPVQDMPLQQRQAANRLKRVEVFVCAWRDVATRKIEQPGDPTGDSVKDEVSRVFFSAAPSCGSRRTEARMKQCRARRLVELPG